MDASFSTTTSQSMDQAQFSLAQAQLKGLNEKGHNHENKADLMKSAQQFESVFFKQFLDEMDKTVDRSQGFLDGGSGEAMFRGMLNDKISEAMATRPGGSGLGIAESIYNQMAQKLKPDTSSDAPEQKGPQP